MVLVGVTISSTSQGEIGKDVLFVSAAAAQLASRWLFLALGVKRAAREQATPTQGRRLLPRARRGESNITEETQKDQSTHQIEVYDNIYHRLGYLRYVD